MTLISTLFLLFLSTTVVVCHLPTGRTTRRPRKGGPMEQEKILRKNRDRQQRSAHSQVNTECQEGIPLGVSYTGTADVTNNGIPCRVWEPSELQDHQGVGHYHCRNPEKDPEGVWCNTDDPDETWGYCSSTVPICGNARLKVFDFSCMGWPRRGWGKLWAHHGNPGCRLSHRVFYHLLLFHVVGLLDQWLQISQIVHTAR